MTKLVFYGGVNEIGGNKILLSDSGTHVLLDFGLSFGMKDKYYDQYLGPRGFAIIDEYVAFGFLPAIKGAYREDHLKHIDPSHPLLGSKSVDAVLISHAHLDHIGMIPYLKPDIRLIGSETTESIMQYLQDTMTGDEQEFCSWSPSFRMVPAKNGEGIGNLANGLIRSNVIRSWKITWLSFKRMELMSLKSYKKPERTY